MPRHAYPLSAAFLLLMLLSACGSVVAGGTGAGGTSTTGTARPHGTTTGTGGSSSGGACPPAQPVGGASCAGLVEGFTCTYGDETRPECREQWVCSSTGTWT